MIIQYNTVFSPVICGKQNDRICGDGPSLQFIFDIDDIYKKSTENILSYFNINYEAVYKYLKRLEYVHIIYIENENLNKETIQNETSTWHSKLIY